MIFPARSFYADIVNVPSYYWEELKNRNKEELCLYAGARSVEKGLMLPFLGEEIFVDFETNRLIYPENLSKIEDPFLELMVLVYLKDVLPIDITGEIIGLKDLKDAQFFHGPHEIKISPLIKCFGQRPDLFEKAVVSLHGRPLPGRADKAFTLFPFPKIPLHYLLWEGDEEFGPNLSILFDSSIEKHLTADAIWGIVNTVSDTLILNKGGQ